MVNQAELGPHLLRTAVAGCVYWHSVCLALRYFGSYGWDLSHTARLLQRCEAGDVLQDEAADHANVRVRPDSTDDGSPQNADECGPHAMYAFRLFGRVHVPCLGAYGCPPTSMHRQWRSCSPRECPSVHLQELTCLQLSGGNQGT